MMAETRRRQYARRTLLCALIPLMIGVGCLLGYWSTRIDLFVGLGLLALVFGAICFVIGFLSWSKYRLSGQLGDVENKPPMWCVLGLLLLLLLNLPAAVFCFVAGAKMLLSPPVDFEMHNISRSSLSRVELISGNGTSKTHSLDPEGKAHVKLVPVGGPLKIRVTRNGKTEEFVLLDHADNDVFRGDNDSAMIVIDNDKAFMISR